MSPAMICSRATPVERARALIGTRFLLHGRHPAQGLDCVGLVGTVYECAHQLPTGYALRGGTARHWTALIDQFAQRRTARAQPGDIVLLRAGVVQFHLGLWTGDSLIHADAGLRRVVETPGRDQWPLVAAWSVEERAR